MVIQLVPWPKGTTLRGDQRTSWRGKQMWLRAARGMAKCCWVFGFKGKKRHRAVSCKNRSKEAKKVLQKKG